MEIGWNPRVYFRVDIGTIERSKIPDPYPILGFFYVGAHFLQFSNEGSAMRGMIPHQFDVASRHQGGEQIGADFDAVGDDLILCSVQALDPRDAQRGGSDPLDLRSHTVQEQRHLLHFGFQRDIVQYDLGPFHKDRDR